jgi:hypothetical protein
MNDVRTEKIISYLKDISKPGSGLIWQNKLTKPKAPKLSDSRRYCHSADRV